MFLIHAFTFTIPLDALRRRTEQFLIPSKKNLLQTNFSGFLMRIKLSSRKIIIITPQCPKQRMIPTVVYSHAFLQNTCLLSRGNHSGLTLNGEPRDEMASDLLNLASALRAENDLPKVFQRMADCQQASDNRESPKNWLDKEVGNAGLAYRRPPTPKDGNSLFHAMYDQLLRLGNASQTSTKLRSDLVNYLRSNPANQMELISVNLSISGHGTLICEE